MDIRQFYKSTKDNQNSYSSQSSQQHSNNTNKQDFSEYEDTINKYKNLSQDELYSELFSQASNLKAQGKLDTNMLENLSTTLAPMLNDEQKQLLNNIMNRLK